MKALTHYIPTPDRRAPRSLNAPTCCCCGRQASPRSANVLHYVLTWKQDGQTFACTSQKLEQLSASHPGAFPDLQELMDIHPDRLWPMHLGASCFKRIHKTFPGSTIATLESGARVIILA